MANIKEALRVIEEIIRTGHKAIQDLRAQQMAAEGQGVGELVATFAAALDAHLNTALTMRAAYEGLVTATYMTTLSEPNAEIVKSTLAGIAACEASMASSAQKLEAAQKALAALQTKASGTAQNAKNTLSKLLPPAPTPPSGGDATKGDKTGSAGTGEKKKGFFG